MQDLKATSSFWEQILSPDSEQESRISLESLKPVLPV